MIFIARNTFPRPAGQFSEGPGLKDIEFLLANWARETTDPNSGNADPDKVRLYLGLRTTTSPLFQIDKLLANAGDKVADDDFEAWVEATENFNSQIAKVNELAYTANFGEYNPGGGKDQARPIPKRCRDCSQHNAATCVNAMLP